MLNIGQCKLNTKVVCKLMKALCLLLSDVVTDRRYTQLDPTAHRRVFDFISGDGILERNINIKKKHAVDSSAGAGNKFSGEKKKC